MKCHASPRLASLVGITERETRVGKLGWHGNSTGFDRKNTSLNITHIEIINRNIQWNAMQYLFINIFYIRAKDK